MLRRIARPADRLRCAERSAGAGAGAVAAGAGGFAGRGRRRGATGHGGGDGQDDDGSRSAMCHERSTGEPQSKPRRRGTSPAGEKPAGGSCRPLSGAISSGPFVMREKPVRPRVQVHAMRTSRVLPAVLAFPLALALAATSAPAADEEPSKGPKELLGLKYRLVGPPAGGRVSRVAGVPGDPLTYYAATASGGVWKSTDGGIRWKPIFDDQPTSLDRLDRRGAVRPERRLRRLRRGQHPRQRGPGQRHLQVHRRRQDLDSTCGSRTARSARWSSTRRTPTSPSRRCSASAFGPEPRARRLPHHDGGEDLAAGALRRTPTPAPPTWRSTPRTRASCSPASGRRGAGPGSW